MSFIKIIKFLNYNMYFTYRQVEQINLPIKYLELMYHLNNLSVIFLRIETVFI